MTYDPILKYQNGLDALEFRELIVNYLPEFIDTKHIYWDTETRGSIEAWMEKFSKNYIFPEQEFLQLACTFLNRKIDLYPVNPYMTGPVRKIELLPHTDCGCGMEMPNYEPFSMLYFEEANFVTPHYQSIRPLSER